MMTKIAIIFTIVMLLVLGGTSIHWAVTHRTDTAAGTAGLVGAFLIATATEMTYYSVKNKKFK